MRDPWEIIEQPLEGGCVIRDSNGLEVCRTLGLESAQALVELNATAARLAAALECVLSDMLDSTDYGMPVENDEHPYHESVTEARAALAAFRA